MLHALQPSVPGVVIIEPEVHRDARGFFLESYHAVKYRQWGIVDPFIQDNHSMSWARTLRGLHLQRREPQGKLVRVIEGEILDVAVDLRRGSPSFGEGVITQLTAENFRQCYVPPGFAHGFYVLSKVAQVEYKCTTLYDPASEIGVAWNDPQLAIPWPDRNPILSDKDTRLPSLAEVIETLPRLEDCLSTLSTTPESR